MRLTQFGTYTLPLFSRRDKLSTGDTGGALVTLVNGIGYDATGAGVAQEAVNTVTCSYEIVETTATAVQTARDAIRALAGTKARLWAQMPDGSLRHVWARLTRVNMERRREYIFYQPVEATFEIDQPGWLGTAHGAPWFLDTGE